MSADRHTLALVEVTGAELHQAAGMLSTIPTHIPIEDGLSVTFGPAKARALVARLGALAYIVTDEVFCLRACLEGFGESALDELGFEAAATAPLACVVGGSLRFSPDALVERMLILGPARGSA